MKRSSFSVVYNKQIGKFYHLFAAPPPPPHTRETTLIRFCVSKKDARNQRKQLHVIEIVFNQQLERRVFKLFFLPDFRRYLKKWCDSKATDCAMYYTHVLHGKELTINKGNCKRR